ncbi:MAG: nuclear transport factor 2 family protein [Anaerolineae bacterium]|nr:nuclear transport factor 2 family protein [Anaerolineae bacterium]
MYHFIVKRIVQHGFREMSKGNYEAAIKLFTPDIHFKFEGNHALGADLHSVEAVREWFQRISRIFPGLQFKPQRIIVSGMPWATHVATQLQISATLPDGRLYQNTAVQFLHLKWGRVLTDYVLEDTQILVTELENMGRQGNAEALAQPMRGG